MLALSISQVLAYSSLASVGLPNVCNVAVEPHLPYYCYLSIIIILAGACYYYCACHKYACTDHGCMGAPSVRQLVHIPENSQNTLVPYFAYNSPVHTKSDDSFITILTNSELHCATPHTLSYKYTQLPSPSPHTLNTLSQGKHPTH
jgi:hypothetical protein